MPRYKCPNCGEAGYTAMDIETIRKEYEEGKIADGELIRRWRIAFCQKCYEKDEKILLVVPTEDV